MHILNIATLFIVLVLVGVEFSVTAFVNRSAWRLEAEPQLKFLSDLAAVLGRVMPFWYFAALLLLGAETWVYRRTPELRVLAAATALWTIATLGSVVWLVPLNNRVAQGVDGRQQIHRTWDRRHRVRVVALAVAGAMLAYVVVR